MSSDPKFYLAVSSMLKTFWGVAWEDAVNDVIDKSSVGNGISPISSSKSSLVLFDGLNDLFTLWAEWIRLYGKWKFTLFSLLSNSYEFNGGFVLFIWSGSFLGL